MSTNLRRAAGIDQQQQPQGADRADSVRNALVANKDKIQAALPRQFSADRLIQLAYTTIRRDQRLMECTLPSLAGAVMDAARLGLEVGVLGQGYIVGYKNHGVMEAQFIPGWQGLVDLVGRAGRAEAWTGAVFEGDAFDWAYGDSPHIKHKPCGEDDPERMTHVYACGRINGTRHPIIEVWPIEKVWRHRDRYNRVGERHYSFKHPEMYARKVVLLQVLKYVPKSPMLTAAIEASNFEDQGKRTTISADYVVMPEGALDPEVDTPDPKELPPVDKSLEGYLSDIAAAEDSGALAMIEKDAEGEFEGVQLKIVKDAVAGRRKALAG